MKKIKLLIILSSISVSLLSGCGNKIQKVKLTYGSMSQDLSERIIDCSTSDIKSKFGDGINNQETFLLNIYATNGCGCTENFFSVLQKYVLASDEYDGPHYIVYKTPYNEELKSLGFDIKQGTVSFAIVSKGKIIKQYRNDIQENIFRNNINLNEEISKYVEKASMIFVGEEELEVLCESNNPFIIEYIRGECGDCSYFNPKLLYQYMDQTKYKIPYYILNMDKYYNDEEEYQYIKDKYELSTDSNETFGYLNGVVPMWQYRKDKVVKDCAVAFNDTIQKNNNTYVVSQSYYNQERINHLSYLQGIENPVIVGKVIPENYIIEYNETYYCDQDNAFKTYKPIIENFLNFYNL